MRLFAGVLLVGTIAAGQAEASSFVVLGGEPAKTPSIVTFGAPAVAAKKQSAPKKQFAATPARKKPAKMAKAQRPLPKIRKISSSVIAMGEPAPDVSGERVAAIPGKKSLNDGPAVIRGGLFGDDASGPVTLPTPDGEKRTLSRPQQRKLERDTRRALREGKPLPQRAVAPDMPKQTTAPVPEVQKPAPAPVPQTEIK